MAGDTTLVLGDFTFSGPEIPEGIEVGGIQQLVVHELIGGIRVVDAMGRRDNALEWSGWFMGTNAKDRADFLDAYRISGQQLELTWGGYDYQVTVSEFKPKMRRLYEYSYRIVCTVVVDNGSASSQTSTTSTDDAVGDDLDTANDLATDVGDSTLTGQMDTLTSAVSAVSTFAGAAQSTINSVLQPLAAAASRVSTLIDTANTQIGAAAGFSGIVAGGVAPAISAALTTQIGVNSQLTSLLQMQGVLGRMNANLSAVNASENVIPVVGGNLFTVAAQQYGDANAWPTIASANDMTDPFVTGAQSLTIPALPGDTDGILSA
jgi:hypothetical protein